MDWWVGGREFAGRVSDWARRAMAGVTAEMQRAERKAKDLTQRIQRKPRTQRKRERFFTRCRGFRMTRRFG
jgi:hypothetical protein